MRYFFFDSSALVKRYIKEPGSARVAEIVNATQGDSLFAARIAAVEVISAITRRARGNDLTVPDALAAIAQCRDDFTRGYSLIEITSSLLTHAMALAEAHALRGYDCVQLAAVLELNERLNTLQQSGLTFLSSDKDLNAAAADEGLEVEDPSSH